MAKKPASPLSQIAATVTVTTPAPVTNNVSLAESRNAAADANVSAYGATDRYARKLIAEFGTNFWRKASTAFKAWQEESKLYDEALKARNHPNPSQARSRLLKRADEICNPQETGTKGKVGIKERAVKEAVALYKAIMKEDDKVGLDDAEKRILSTLKTYMIEGLKLDLGNLPK